MTTNEHRIILYYEQKINDPVLTYFDPLVFLREIPIILNEYFIDQVVEFYKEKIRRLNLIDLFHLFQLRSEATIENVALNKVFLCEEVSKKLKLFYNLYSNNDFSMTGVEYFTQFPVGRGFGV